MWRLKLYCPHEECNKHDLSSCGMYTRVRQVLDIKGYSSLASEYLECGKCGKKFISWSDAILNQLDVGHRRQFPCIITYNYACDMRVVRLLRQRGKGNSSTQLEKVSEQHRETWLQHVAKYLTDCQTCVAAAKRNLVVLPQFEQVPPCPSVPKAKWLLTVYCRDVMTRLEDVKASITSTFGTLLKIDSTKKVVKKLAGHSAGTAAWATNVGNEFGQVLTTVLTASEGCGLRAMAAGLVRRFELTGVRPPKIMYTDRDCCGERPVSVALFSAWVELLTRLDAWHWIRCIALGCTTESHPLYGTFMARLSQSIFEWVQEDLELLMSAKRAEHAASNIAEPTDDDIMQHHSRRELQLHVRRQTRGVDATTALVEELIEVFSGPQGTDTLGVPLLDCDKIRTIWASQKRHIPCLQDPGPECGVQLYTKVGTLTKGGVELPVFRCAQGLTSLESFHNHLKSFIPGTSANDMHFQAFLLEGLVRWNKDREAAVTPSVTAPCYDSILTAAVNQLSASVFGEAMYPQVKGPRKYTGN